MENSAGMNENTISFRMLNTVLSSAPNPDMESENLNVTLLGTWYTIYLFMVMF